MMRVVKILAGVVLVLAAALVAVGAMLPEKHTVSRSITLHRSIDEVWQTLTDHKNDPGWRWDVQRVTRLADRNGHPVWEEEYKNGQKVRIETLSAQPPTRIERKIVDQSAFGGVWVYELTPTLDAESTTVRITENGEVYNPAFRFIGRFIIGHATTVEKYLGHLSVKFGEPQQVKS